MNSSQNRFNTFFMDNNDRSMINSSRDIEAKVATLGSGSGDSFMPGTKTIFNIFKELTGM